MARSANTSLPGSNTQTDFGVWHAVALFGAGLYFVAFFLWSPVRWLRLSWLLIPEVMFEHWVGGDVSRVGLTGHFGVLVAAGALTLLALLAGGVFVSFLKLPAPLGKLEAFLFAAGSGFSLLSLATLTLGLAGLLQQRAAFGLLVVLIGALAFARRGPLRALLLPETPPDSNGRSGLARLSLWMVIPFGVVIFWGSMLPPWHFDVREYHAQVPKEWFQAGSIRFLEHNVYGNMPLGAEMHAILGMQIMLGESAWWWGTLVGKLVIGSFAGLTGLAVFAFGRRFLSADAGAAGAFVFVSTPWVAHVSMAGLIDVVTAFFLLMTLFAVLLWYERPWNERNGYPILAGFLAGGAVACKYPGLLFVAVPACAFLAARLAIHRRLLIRPLVLFGLGLLGGCGLWLAKNEVWTGNPTYPLLYEWFGGVDLNEARNEQWTRAHRAPAGGFSLTAAVTSATLLLIGSEWLSPLLLPFALVGSWGRSHRRVFLVMLVTIGFVVVSWWLLTHRVDRFLLPILPFVALLAGRGMTRVDHPIWNRVLVGLMAVTFICNLSLISSRSNGDNRFLVDLHDLRHVTIDELNEFNPHLHPSHVYLNEAVRPGYQALLCGEAQVFNLEPPILYNTCFDDCRFERLMKGRSRDERYAALRRHRISHILVSWYELDRYRSPGNYGYSDYITRDLVRRELVGEQGILRRVPLEINPDNVQVFEVVGWQDWPADGVDH